MRLAPLLATIVLVPVALANGHVDSGQGTSTGPFGILSTDESHCNDLAADIRALDVIATNETLTLSLGVWDGTAGPECAGAPLIRDRLDHSMLVDLDSGSWVRFDLTERSPVAGAVTTAACGAFRTIGRSVDSNGTARWAWVSETCLAGVVRSGDATTFTMPIHGTVVTPDGAFDYDLRGGHAWTVGYTHSLLRGIPISEDWVTMGAST